jgi:hypothetical protein
LSTTTDSAGERGFLGIAFDPNFTSNHYVYVYHTLKGSPPTTASADSQLTATSPCQEAKWRSWISIT